MPNRNSYCVLVRERAVARENPSESRVDTKPSEMTSDPGTRSEDYRDRVSWPRAETRSELRVLGDLREPGKESNILSGTSLDADRRISAWIKF